MALRSGSTYSRNAVVHLVHVQSSDLNDLLGCLRPGKSFFIRASIQSSGLAQSRALQMRSAVVVTRSLLDIAIKLMNHFPLFALLLRIKDPRRLPGLYILHICGRVDDRGKGTTYFRVVHDKGHPVLLLEVHRLATSGRQTIYPRWHRYKLCPFGQSSCNTDFHMGKGPNKGYFREVVVIFMRTV